MEDPEGPVAHKEAPEDQEVLGAVSSSCSELATTTPHPPTR